MLKEHPGDRIVVLDKLTYAGRLENLEAVMDRITFVKGDICDKDVVKKAMDGCDAVVNFAAESHVDRSITSPEDFVTTDVIGVFTLLEEARRRDVKRFVQISTDEVYGSTVSGSFSEKDILDPSSPYSASKAGGELLARSYVRTYGLDVIVTRSSNNYWPFQYPEKLIPVLVIKALRDQSLPIYGKGMNVRDWLHVEDNCRAIDLVLQKAKAGDIVNIGSGNEVPNIEVAKLILRHMKKPESLITYVQDRPGHDFRYSLEWDRLKALGWAPKIKFEDGLRSTVDWYLANRAWWEPLL
jgi:dTDP-glucose 4,6-dehydratase